MTKDRARFKAAKYIEWAEIAEKKARQIIVEFNSHPGANDWNYWTQPIHSNARGRAFANQRERLRNKIGKSNELSEKAKRFREKAENLLRFANTNKGDAERNRDLRRADNDELIGVGTEIYDFAYREGIVIKVNKKTYTIRWASGGIFTRDKSYVEPLKDPS